MEYILKLSATLLWWVSIQLTEALKKVITVF